MYLFLKQNRKTRNVYITEGKRLTRRLEKTKLYYHKRLYIAENTLSKEFLQNKTCNRLSNM